MKVQRSPSFTGLQRIGVLIGLFLGVTIGSGQGTKDTSDRAVLPKKVMNSFNARFPQALITQQTREMEEGKEVYDIEFTQAGIKFEADLFADGSISNWEREVTVKELPAAVRKAAEQRYPGATLREIMSVTGVKVGKETLEGYEILLVATDKKEYEVTISPDGKVLEDSADEK